MEQMLRNKYLGQLSEYQLFYQDEEPCPYFLAVNGAEEKPITTKELETQGQFRKWHWDHQLKPLRTTKQAVFEEFMERLWDRKTKCKDPLPFMKTDAGRIETLATYFGIHVPNGVRRKGDEFLAGKYGDIVRVRKNIGRGLFQMG